MFSSSASQVSSDANFIEDVFQTWLYTGNGSTQTITNGIDLAGKGGLVWIKSRSGFDNHIFVDSARGVNSALSSNSTSAADTGTSYVSALNSTGFAITSAAYVNTNNSTYASWTFREQAKFFDVVTYTGDGTAGRTVAHNLGSVPGCILIKATDSAQNWFVYHRSLNNDYTLILNSTSAKINSAVFNFTDPTSTNFTLGTSSGVNGSGISYVAYLFAHNAGGFGLTGNDNVISCGSFTTDGSGNAAVNLGYEPQWLMVKTTAVTGSWFIVDNMRGMPVGGAAASLYPNLSNAESLGNTYSPSATGFNYAGTASEPFIYIAIRRGPMKVPTTGTSVFTPIARSGTSGTATITAGFAPDVIWSQVRNYSQDDGTFDKLRGAVNLRRTSTGAEYAAANAVTAYTNTGVTVGVDSDTGAINSSGGNYGNWIFQRAPGFFDEVCYTGTGSATTFSHNLGVVPEMMIVKKRSASGTDWNVYHSALGNTQVVFLDLTNATATAPRWNDTTPTASVFSIGSHTQVNESGATFVWYGFATCPGVSKVGSYTGTGTTQTINCGFTGGARFVMIKRTDDTGDWYVWDTARGIVSGNDPHLSLNTTAAEVTTDDTIDTDSTGFVVNQVSATNVNVSSATYIFLAIA